MDNVFDLASARKKPPAPPATNSMGFNTEMISMEPAEILAGYENFFGVKLNFAKVTVRPDAPADDIESWGFAMAPGPEVLSRSDLTHRACYRFRKRYHLRVFDNFEGMIAAFMQCFIEDGAE